MKLISYQIFNDSICLYFSNGRRVSVFLDENSGRIVTRSKVNTISNVQHPGIRLGYDKNGRVVILHNHYEAGQAYISTFEEYAKGKLVFWQDGDCANDKLTTIKKGLDKVISGEKYDWYSYNCQTYVNQACHNKSHSEDVEKWAGWIAGGTLIGFGLSLLFGAIRS